MKLAKVGCALFAAAFMLLVYGGSKPQAFHDGGVAECSGCHSMHSAKMAGMLLVGSDQSSTCLSCHQHAGDTGPSSYHISTAEADMPAGVAPKQRTPGGDFGWLKKSYTWSPRSGTTSSEAGETHGHNIIAADMSYVFDSRNTTAPGGGAFSGSKLGCQSCHDPHGRARRLSDGSFVNAVYNPGSQNAPIIASGSYTPTATNPNTPAAGQAVGIYRLLRGLGDNSQGPTFTGVAVAIAPSTYNQTEAVNQVRVAYGGANTGNTWGTWCGTCHPDMHTTGDDVHPVDHSLGATVASNYNSYKKSGDLTGTNADSFLSLTPFIENTSDITILKSHASNSGAYKLGPSVDDQVSCLTCHRAHASGFKDSLRFNLEYEMMVYNGTYTGSAGSGMGRTETEMAGAYYDRPAANFASYQRVLCNKCHAKD